MRDFYHRRFNLLVCTTIIESGIDIPTANTIIMNRADKLGLAQLHQLRGRVGRSHHRAYAYLLVPPRKAMTADAVKRLEAIESMDELGAGFTLALMLMASAVNLLALVLLHDPVGVVAASSGCDEPEQHRLAEHEPVAGGAVGAHRAGRRPRPCLRGGACRSARCLP